MRAGNEATFGGPVLSLDEAVALGLERDRGVRDAALEVQQAAGAVSAARSQRLPGVRFRLRGARSLTPESYLLKPGHIGAFRETGPIPTETEGRASGPLTGLLMTEAAQPLSQQYRFGLGIEELELRRSLAGERLRGQRQRSAHDIKRAYYRTLEHQGAVEAGEDWLAVLRQIGGLAAADAAAADAPRAGTGEIRRRLAAAETEVEAQRAALEVARSQLNLLLGRDAAAPLRVRQDAEALPSAPALDEARRRAVERRPEVRIADLRVKQAEVSLRIERAGFIPDISALFYHAQPLDTGGLPGELAYAGLQLSTDIFDWGRRSREVAERHRAVAQAQNAARDARARVTREADDRAAAVQAANAQLLAAAAGRNAARGALAAAVAQLRRQPRLLEQALAAQLAAQQAEGAYRRALSAFLTARADLERGLGEDW